jgi:hypothetical protein
MNKFPSGRVGQTNLVMVRPPPEHAAIPASADLAKFLDEHDPSTDGSAAFITHLDETPVRDKAYVAENLGLPNKRSRPIRSEFSSGRFSSSPHSRS